GMAPFRPFDEHGPVMSYYQLPEEVLEEPERLRHWAERAIAGARVARRKKAKAVKRRTTKKRKRKK
ncbi:MAG TPA: TfoX/Sxy family protein, partial [Gemmatimonadaceae bacterium]|nr:TfoX/Sxy family protein [Gemmatimonadaceae bacterium]